MKIGLIPPAALDCIIPLLQILNPALSDDTLTERLAEMQTQGYQCAGAWHADHHQLIGICGLWIRTKYYIGKHIEPDNVLVHPDHQGQGIGGQLIAWVHRYAKEQGCVASELNCYLGNINGHAFWQKNGYSEIAKHFQKKLE